MLNQAIGLDSNFTREARHFLAALVLTLRPKVIFR